MASNLASMMSDTSLSELDGADGSEWPLVNMVAARVLLENVSTRSAKIDLKWKVTGRRRPLN